VAPVSREWQGALLHARDRWGNGGSFSGTISVNDGKWHYVGATQRGSLYTIYVDGVLDVQKAVGTPVSYDPTVAAGIGYGRRDAAYYFNGDIDELGVWFTTLTNMDFLTLYNNGIGYAYPYSVGSLATTTYSAQPYTYDALGNFTTKGSNNYTYAQTGYANPDAVTQIANGVSTTTYGYDGDGNLTSAGTSTFSWDYRNRLTQAVTQGSTSTYAYDDGLNRVSQTVGNTTTIYPHKYYSITSTTNGGTTYATTTVYVWNGDTLIATIDQPIVNGANSGSAVTRYIHPDHLGSTNVVSDESGNVADTLEYYPYGETRLNQPSYPTNAQRQYIAQFKDGNSLSYLNARYLNSQQGQFLSEDPVFLGNPSQQNLQDPQSLNSYSYAENNPLTKKDPTGLLTQAQNSQLNSIKNQLFTIQAALGSGNVTAVQISSIQQTVNSASAAVSRIAVGGNATLSPAYAWAPPTTPGYVAPYTPNLANGVLPVAGGNTPEAANAVLIGLSLIPGAGELGPDEALGVKGAVNLVERNGLKFDPAYYHKLWDTGRAAPSLIAHEIIQAAGNSTPDLIEPAKYVVYEYKGWRVVIDPVTNFIKHLGP
jgi:RHS repeat-associated protein